MEELLQYRNVKIAFRGRTVIDDVSFALHPGEILGIVGESGSGKSTLLKAAMGLLGSGGKITFGDIFFQGKNIPNLRENELRLIRGAGIGMIFQDAGASLCPVRRVGKQIYESMAAHEKISREQARKKALELFEKLRFPDSRRIWDSYPFELSGGMNQRVGIMMAMVLRPALLFADEPTSALDVTVQAQVVREMMKMRDIYGTGIVVVTHNIGMAEYMADRIAVMYEGRLVEYGRTEDLIHHPKEAYTKRLIGSVLRIDRG